MKFHRCSRRPGQSANWVTASWFFAWMMRVSRCVTEYGAIDGGATSCHVGGSAVDVRSPHCLPRGAYLHVSVPQETTDGVQTPPPPQWESTPAVWVARDLRCRMGRCLVAHCYTPTQVEQTRFRLATAPHSGKYSTCGSVVVRSPASGHTANNKYVRKEEKCCPM